MPGGRCVLSVARRGGGRRGHAAAVGRRPVLGHPGHVDLGAGQRRHRDRRPRQSVQRLRLSEAAGARRRRPRSCRNRYLTRLRPRARRRRALRFDHAGASTSGIVVDRAIFAPKDTNYLRYVDSFTNATGEPRTIERRVGRRRRRLRRRRPGDRGDHIERRPHDRSRPTRFVTVMQNAQRVGRPDARSVGPRSVGARARHRRPPALLTPNRRHVRRSVHRRLARLRSGAHRLRLHASPSSPGSTVSLMTFVVKGLSEIYDPRGGFPISIARRARRAEELGAVTRGPAPSIPAAGSQIARVTDVARRLVADPDLRGLTPRQRAQIVNWRLRRGARRRRSRSSRRPCRSCRTR